MKRYIVSRKTGKMFTLNRPGISKICKDLQAPMIGICQLQLKKQSI